MLIILSAFRPFSSTAPPHHDSGYCQKALEQILGIRDMPTVMERSGLRTRNRRGDREQRGLEPIRDLVSQGQLQDLVSVQGATAMWEHYETCDGNSFEENKLLLYYMYSPADNKIGPLSIETLALVTGAGRGRVGKLRRILRSSLPEAAELDNSGKCDEENLEQEEGGLESDCEEDVEFMTGVYEAEVVDSDDFMEEE